MSEYHTHEKEIGSEMRTLALQQFTMVVFILVATAVQGDEVVMKNGDRLRGEVVSMTRGKLVLKTSYAGNVSIDWGEVSRMTTNRPFELTLDDENTVKGESINSPKDRFIAVTPPQGSTTAIFSFDEIAKIEPVKDKVWELTGRLILGLNVETGNTEKTNFHFEGDAEIANQPHRIKLFAESTVETNDKVRTDDKQYFSGTYSYFLTKNWFLLTDTRFQRDQFADLSAFGILSVGPGYQFWRSYEKNLSISMGPGYAIQKYSKGQSFLDGDSTRQFPAAVWSMDFDIWLFKQSLQFFHHNAAVFNLTDRDAWDIRTRTGLRIPLFWRLFANLQYNFSYANQPADGKLSNDSKFVTALGLKW